MTTESENITSIHGQSFLNFSSQISPSSSVSATWFAQVSVQESYGSDLLENQSLGIREQIDRYIGNYDGFIDSNESLVFGEMVESARNWTDSSSGGCCEFDYTPFIALEGVNITVISPEVGPVNQSSGSWGWIENANLSGTSDGRTLRLLDIPRVGNIIEELPLSITLPEGWELIFSPMMEIIEGNPREFSVNRSEAPVAHDIRITIAQNTPPMISSTRFPSSISTIALEGMTSLSAVCTDSLLDSPTIEWSVFNDEELIVSSQKKSFDFSPSEHNLSHGEIVNIVAKCWDFHGMESSSQENLSLDGIAPTWNGNITLVNETITEHDITEGLIVTSEGSQLIFMVNSSDEMGLPVNIELFTNITEGWRQFGSDIETFQFSLNQGISVNGAHLPIAERHLKREPTLLSMLIQLSDDAGNIATNEWEIIVTDSRSPTIIAEILIDGEKFDINDGLHENDNASLLFSKSFN